jgi:hypothetical protein
MRAKFSYTQLSFDVKIQLKTKKREQSKQKRIKAKFSISLPLGHKLYIIGDTISKKLVPNLLYNKKKVCTTFLFTKYFLRAGKELSNLSPVCYHQQDNFHCDERHQVSAKVGQATPSTPPQKATSKI